MGFDFVASLFPQASAAAAVVAVEELFLASGFPPTCSFGSVETLTGGGVGFFSGGHPSFFHLFQISSL